MKNILFSVYLALTAILVARPAAAQKKTIDQKVDSLMRLMTLDEKIGQMNQYNGFWDATGPAPSEQRERQKYEHLKKGLVGSVLNVRGTAQVRKLQEIVVKGTRLGIPLIFGFDVIHGYKTIMPIPLGETSSWDMDLLERSARIAAIEAAAVGINWTFAPMVDISRDARWGRVMEGAGEDPYLGSKVAVARIKGFQGSDLSGPFTIAATAKHFAGYGFAESGKDYNTVDVGSSTMYNVIFPPFKAAVESNVKTVMNSFNVVNGVPATANRYLQRDILKGEWKFRGFVVSDWGSGQEMIDHGFAGDLKQVAALSVNAGSDMDMESYAYVTHLKELVENGTVDIRVIDDAVRRILRVKFELGLFDDPYRYCNPEREKTMIGHPDHLSFALEAANKSIVLLKNENQLLPLRKNQQSIAVIGALADDKNSPLGNWRLAADDNSAVSVIEGIRKISTQFTYAMGAQLVKGEIAFPNELLINESDTSGFEEAVNLAKRSEVVIMVLGEHGFQSGEGRSRSRLDLPGVQQQLLEAIYRVNKKIVLVLMNGRPLAIPWADKHIPAIIEAWHLGTESGNAIAQTLFGENNPSGKLPMTFPRSVGQVPVYYNYFNTGRSGPKKEVFWSHYIDETNAPLYPFGFGLSYTSFTYTNFRLSKNAMKADQPIIAELTISNTGNYEGEEIVQLYIRDKVGSLVRPVKELKDFKKIKLVPGESKNVRFVINKEKLSFYNQVGKLLLEPGEFEVMIGASSGDIRFKQGFALIK